MSSPTQWQQSGQFGVNINALTSGATDASPNVTDPRSGSSALQARVRRLGKTQAGPSRTLALYCMTGTTVTAIPWILEESTNTWLQASAALTATPTAPSFETTQNIDQAVIFWQVTANTATTKIGWTYP